MSLVTELKTPAVRLIYKYFAPNGAGRFTEYRWLKTAIRAEGDTR